MQFGPDAIRPLIAAAIHQKNTSHLPATYEGDNLVRSDRFTGSASQASRIRMLAKPIIQKVF